MEGSTLPEWEPSLVEEAVRDAQRRRKEEKERAKKRALQLAREQAYHRLAYEITRPATTRSKEKSGQLSFWPSDPTLFDDAS